MTELVNCAMFPKFAPGIDIKETGLQSTTEEENSRRGRFRWPEEGSEAVWSCSPRHKGCVSNRYGRRDAEDARVRAGQTQDSNAG